MRIRGSVRKLCESCFVVRRRGKLFVMCKKNPKVGREQQNIGCADDAGDAPRAHARRTPLLHAPCSASPPTALPPPPFPHSTSSGSGSRRQHCSRGPGSSRCRSRRCRGWALPSSSRAPTGAAACGRSNQSAGERRAHAHPAGRGPSHAGRERAPSCVRASAPQLSCDGSSFEPTAGSSTCTPLFPAATPLATPHVPCQAPVPASQI